MIEPQIQQLYRPLDASRREIRILRPACLSSPSTIARVSPSISAAITVIPDLILEFELDVISLLDRTEYTTLSYRWGSEKDPETILVNGCQFSITQSLYTALRHLSSSDMGKGIWIDMICINQLDPTEKDEQIMMMDRIYSNAIRCIAWLGEATTHSAYFAECLHRLRNLACERFQILEKPKYYLYDYFDFETEVEILEFVRQIMVPHANNATGNISSTTPPYATPGEFCRAFVEFMSSHEWWFRVWIMQEFVLSRAVVFQVGNCKLGLEEVMSMFMFYLVPILSRLDDGILSYPAASIVRTPGHEWIMRLLTYRERREKGSFLDYTSVFEVLCATYCQPFYPNAAVGTGEKSKGPRAKHRRDQIWALRSLFASDFKDMGLKEVNHKHLSWEDVYCDAARCLIEHGHLDILSLRTSGMVGVESQQQLPSWVPVWHEPIQPPFPGFCTTREGEKTETGFRKRSRANNLPLGNSLFKAGTQRKVEVTFGDDHSTAERVDAKARSMHIAGIKVDEVLSVGTIYPRTSEMHLSHRQSLFGNLFHDIDVFRKLSWSLGNSVYSTPQLQESVWRIPIMDQELPDSDERPMRRATSASEVAYKRCLPLFQSTRAHASEERALDTLEHSCLQAVWTWPRILIYRALSAFHFSKFRQELPSWRKPWAFLKWFCASITTSKNPLYVRGSMPPGVSHYMLSMEIGRSIRPFITRKGYIGLGPPTTQPGNLLCVFFGSHIPHILRAEPETEETYTFVGDAYTYGLMDGEALRMGYDTTQFCVL
ncbi:heterokaryon incompatibility protein-domain-containing protein [Xylariaceae sp. FL1272]|nr:heterokaryon incompatibility protein-domain-containing protein [Xylariaceae sp. FL1272]